LFATCSIQVPNGFPSVTPFFNEGITSEERKKNWGGGGGEGETHCGNQKVFGCHSRIVIEFGHYLMGLIKFGYH